MQFDRDEIAAQQQARSGSGNERFKNPGFIQAVGGGGSERGGVNRASGHVAAINLLPIEMNHRPIVALEAEEQFGEQGAIGHGEPFAEIVGDNIIADPGELAIQSVAKSSRRAFPGPIVESAGRPIASLIGAVVQVLPGGAGREKEGR